MHPLGLLLASAAGLAPVPVKIPGQVVEVSVEIPGFRTAKQFVDEHGGDKDPALERIAEECAYDLAHPNERQLLFGVMRGGALVSVLFEENMPYLAAAECGQRWVKESRYKRFEVGELEGCEFRMEKRAGQGASVGITHWHAFLTTPDYLIDLHVSADVHSFGSGASGDFTRADFLAVAKTLTLTGRADVAKLSLPPEVYAFRDEAARAGSDPLGWVSKQCLARKDDWAAAFYLGALADQREKPDVSVQGYSRAAELLGAMRERSAKHSNAFVTALDRAAWTCASQKKYKEAIPFCAKLVEVVPASDPPELRKYREQALYHLACCQAATGKHSAAIETLRQAIAEKPEFKESAAQEELLAPLRTKPEFKKLVGG